MKRSFMFAAGALFCFFFANLLFSAQAADSSTSDHTAPVISMLLLTADQDCSSATPMHQQENGLGGDMWISTGAIDQPGQKDFFSFPTGESKRWWALSVGRTSDDPTNQLDPVLTLYSADGTSQMAQNDDYIPSGGASDLLHRFLSFGTYCIQVEDVSTFKGLTPQGGAGFQYRVTALPVDFSLYDSYNEENRLVADSRISPQTGLSSVSTGQGFQQTMEIAGFFDASLDGDYYEIITPTEALSMTLEAIPPGIDGNGSKAEFKTISVWKSGEGTLSELDITQGARQISMPVTEGENYVLVVEDTSVFDTVNGNNFYSLRYKTYDTRNQQESNDINNNSSATPEVASPINNVGFTSYYIEGTLTGSQDTDWWSFSASSGDEVSLHCNSWRSGSGVRDANFSIFFNPGASALQSETEMETFNLYWDTTANASMPRVPISSTGTHYLKVSASTFSTEVLGRYYKCGFHVF